jgi:hypothetical protein
MVAPAQQHWASPAEHELYRSALAEEDPTQALYLLERWRAAYPQSAFKDLQLELDFWANQQLGRVGGAFQSATELAKLNPTEVVALHWLVLTGPKLPSPTAEQIEIVAAAAHAILSPVPTPAAYTPTALLNGVPAKVNPSAQPKRPPPVPPTTLESSTPEGQAVTAMLSSWRRNYRARPAPDPAVQRKTDAEAALEWVRQVRR